MRKLLLCTATVALSGCSFLGFGGQGGHYSAAPSPSHMCSSGKCYSRFNLEGGVGVSSMVDGRAVTASQSASPGMGDFTMRAMYDMGVRAELGGSMALSPNTKLTAIGHYEHAGSAGETGWGFTPGGQKFRGALSDYEAWGGELGLRHYFAPQRGIGLRSVRPYLEARVGTSRINDISIEQATLDGVAVNGGQIAFYDDTWVASGSGLIGLETPLTQYSTIALETGLRYRGDLDADNTDIAGPAAFLAGANDGGSALSVPVMIRGRYRF